MARLKMLATPAGMAAAALTQEQRRGGVDHRFVIGRHVAADGRIVLEAIERGPAWDIPRPLRFTQAFERFARWRTRQAATQFARRWHLADVHVFDCDWLDVLAARPS